MAKEITMPSMGADMTEGTIVKWLKQEGDKVSIIESKPFSKNKKFQVMENTK